MNPFASIYRHRLGVFSFESIRVKALPKKKLDILRQRLKNDLDELHPTTDYEKVLSSIIHPGYLRFLRSYHAARAID